MKRHICAGFVSVFFILGVLLGGCVDDSDSGNDAFTVSRHRLVIPTTYKGYSESSGGFIRVINQKSSAISVNIELTGEGAENFSLSSSSLDLDDNASGIFRVTPQTGLDIGVYTATVAVSSNSKNSTDITVNFTVVEGGLHAYIAFGQSNMQGPATIRDQDKTGIDYDRWQTLNVVAGRYANQQRAKGQWYDAVPPLIIPDVNLPHWDGGTFTTGLGPTDYFGRTLVASTDGIKFGVIAVANGDLALASYHKTKGAEYFDDSAGGKENGRPSSTERQGWTRYTTGSGAYTSMYDAIISNAKIAQEQGYIIKGIIVHQGESGRGLTYTTWHEMLKEIYNDMLADLELAPDSIPILLGQLWNAGTGPGGYLNTDNVLIKAVIPNAWVISSEGCNEGRTGKGQPDNLHFGSADLETLGTRYGEKMLELNY